MKVAIAGSGIAGLALARGLERVGIEVSIYERAPALGEVGAGISLWSNALRALEALGAAEGVLARSRALSGRTEIRVDSGRRVALGFDVAELEAALGLSPVVTVIHRADLVEALSEGLSAERHYGRECSGVETTEGGRARLRFRDGGEAEADLAVGADGIHSAARRSLFGDEETRYAGYTCWRGICDRPSECEAGYFGEWWGRGRRFGITPLPGDRVYWWATLNAPAGGRAEGEGGERAEVSRAFAGWSEPVGAILESTAGSAVLRNDIRDRRPDRSKWWRGRVALIGDAAHPTTPNLGQGGCMAIEDGLALARALGRSKGDVEGALRGFVAERHARTASVTRESWRFGRLGQLSGAWSTRLRDWAVSTLGPRVGVGGLLKHARHDPGGLP